MKNSWSSFLIASLCPVLLLTVSLRSLADSFGPCQAGTVAAIENTTCTIGDKTFSFGSWSSPFSAESVSFTPDADKDGFTLTGNFSVSGGELTTGGFDLPITVATVNGLPTILGDSTSFVGTVSGVATVAQSGFFLCASGNGPCVNAFVSNTSNVLIASNLEVPVSSLTGSAHIFLRSGFLGEPVEITSASYFVEQTPVPEPSSFLLLGTGFLGAVGALRRKLLG